MRIQRNDSASISSASSGTLTRAPSGEVVHRVVLRPHAYAPYVATEKWRESRRALTAAVRDAAAGTVIAGACATLTAMTATSTLAAGIGYGVVGLGTVVLAPLLVPIGVGLGVTAGCVAGIGGTASAVIFAAGAINAGLDGARAVKAAAFALGDELIHSW